MDKNIKNTQTYKPLRKFTVGILIYIIISFIALGEILLSFFKDPYFLIFLIITTILVCLYIFYPRKQSLINNTRRAGLITGFILVAASIRMVLWIINNVQSDVQYADIIAFASIPILIISFVLGLIFTISAKIKPSEIFK